VGAAKASTEAQASAVTKQEEDLTVRARQVNQREREVEKLEGLLQEKEELDDITLRRELEALSTRETSLDRREADLEWEQKALEDARAQILARELDADARDTGLRDQRPDWQPGSGSWWSGRCRSWLLPRRAWKTSGPPKLATDSVSGASWARQTLLWRPLASALSGEGTWHLKPASYFPFWTRQGGKYPSWRRLSTTA
jgi:hypothetical protein